MTCGGWWKVFIENTRALPTEKISIYINYLRPRWLLNSVGFHQNIICSAQEHHWTESGGEKKIASIIRKHSSHRMFMTTTYLK